MGTGFVLFAAVCIRTVSELGRAKEYTATMTLLNILNSDVTQNIEWLTDERFDIFLF